MDAVDQLIKAFGLRGKRNQSLWKLDVLMDLGRLDDPRVVAFLAAVVVDGEEPADVRLDALGRLRECAPAGAHPQVAEAGRAVLDEPAPIGLRLHAAVVLGDVVEEPCVLEALGVLTRDVAAPIELRYNAFTSLQRAGPTPACLAILGLLSGDEVLGQTARSVLATWGAT